MGKIYWLASYPKSGNTWLRVLLTNYLKAADEPADINRLSANLTDYARTHLDEWLGLESSALNAAELNHYRLLFQEHLATLGDQPIFVKAHALCLPIAGRLPFSSTATAGVIFLIRNPLDVAVSFAHHMGRTIEHTIQIMGDEQYILRSPSHRLHNQPQGSWSSHARSWVDNQAFATHIVRYEDLLASPEATFAEIIRFTGLELDQTRIRQAVEFASFERLQAQEQAHGFVERPIPSVSFFRQGRTGTWRDALSDAQAAQIIATHRDVMEHFGYLTAQGTPVY